MANVAITGGLLNAIPATLRDELLTAYNQIVNNYREGRWEPSELNGGKLCEVTFTILNGYIQRRFPARASKPRNMIQSCQALEQAATTIPRSVRVQIPRMLIALYEVRNNRGVGHVGGDVDPNRMDATCVFYMSKWVIAELVRIFHNVDTKTAEEAVEAIVERTLPVIWHVEGNMRVLDTRFTMKDKVLLLLYNNPQTPTDQDLIQWVEHSNPSVFRRDILRPLHVDRLIEYNETTNLVHISPSGIRRVEIDILPRADASI
jgi:hypothetical protein